MARETVEQGKQALEAFRRGDAAWLQEHSTPDVVIVQPAEVPDSKAYEGPSAWREAMDDWPNEWVDFHIDFVEAIDVSDEVLVLVTRHHGRGALSGIEMDFEVFYVSYGRDKLLSRMEMYLTGEQARKAAGLEG